MIHDELIPDAKRLIDSLASTPRFAGSAGESRARKACEEELRASGYAVAEREFQFSQWPGRWGIPLISGWLLLSIAAIALTAQVAAESTALAAGVVVLAAGKVFAAGRRDRATAAMKVHRSASKNLEATRGAPALWLVAHLDSKSQAVPMLLRVVSHLALMMILAGALAIGFAGIFLASPFSHWGWVGIAALLSALPGLFCFAGNRSRGALDNATGVAAVLLTARLIPRDRSIGVLITSGEELDLAGARAWTSPARGEAMMLNCDTIDEKGGWRCFYVREPNSMCRAAEMAAKKLGLPLRIGKVIPGIITDSLAFESGGLPSVTISRGTLQTLARLHTQGDNPDRLSGAGAATATRLLAAMVEELS